MEKLVDLGSILNYRKPTHKSDDVATNGNFWADEPVCPTGHSGQIQLCLKR